MNYTKRIKYSSFLGGVGGSRPCAEHEHASQPTGS
jgi:hypothetical protein